MFTKEQALASCAHETEIIKHLAGKIREPHLDYRPTAVQRSLLELLQYLTVTSTSVARYIVTGNWDHALGLKEQSEKVTLENFPQAMDAQLSDIAAALADFDDDALAQHASSMPWGTPCTGGEAVVNMVLKALVAYRMQLFLYLRALELEISTVDCWVGQDAS